MADIRERFVKTNGVNLHVLEAGPEDGPMIVFLHGFPDCCYAWRRHLSYFADKGYLAVAPDQRGYNLSDKPEGVDAYHLNQLAGDFLGLIESYGRREVFLVGHDLGGMVSWWTAAHYPEHIKRLVIMNCPHPSVIRENLFGNVKQMQKSWYVFFFQVPRAPEKMISAHDFSWPVNVLGKTSRPGTFSKEELEEYRKAFAQPGSCQAMINWYRSFVPLFFENQDPLTIKVPTLVLWGVNDTALVPEQARQSAACCENSRVVYFDEATHWVQHEEAQQINPMLEKFFQEA
jgi:pimeloyl-ACP methyl ester carboxylesterase